MQQEQMQEESLQEYSLTLEKKKSLKQPKLTPQTSRKEDQTKPKVNRRKEIKMIRVEIEKKQQER